MTFPRATKSDREKIRKLLEMKPLYDDGYCAGCLVNGEVVEDTKVDMDRDDDGDLVPATGYCINCVDTSMETHVGYHRLHHHGSESYSLTEWERAEDEDRTGRMTWEDGETRDVVIMTMTRDYMWVIPTGDSEELELERPREDDPLGRDDSFWYEVNTSTVPITVTIPSPMVDHDCEDAAQFRTLDTTLTVKERIEGLRAIDHIMDVHGPLPTLKDLIEHVEDFTTQEDLDQLRTIR